MPVVIIGERVQLARQVLLDRTVFTLDTEHYQRFAKLLDAPVKADKALNRLLNKTAPWERSSPLQLPRRHR